MGLAVVRDLRDEARAPAGPEELADFKTDVLAGFVLARAAAGLADGTIRCDVGHLEQVRAWFGRPLWEMDPADADACFGRVLRATAKGTRLLRAQARALKTYFLFLELRHKVEIHALTGRVVQCPIDKMNRQRRRGRRGLARPVVSSEGRPVSFCWVPAEASAGLVAWMIAACMPSAAWWVGVRLTSVKPTSCSPAVYSVKDNAPAMQPT